MDQSLASPKFSDPHVTAGGEPRAWVAPDRLRTLWFNTGTLCNLTCANCYIESSPKNDSLVYISTAEVAAYLDECAAEDLGLEEVGFTGGEPFMNPEMIDILETALSYDVEVLLLTNAMRPMMKRADDLLALKARYGDRLTFRVSIDHYTREGHEAERGPHSWDRMLPGLRFLAQNGFAMSAAGRTFVDEGEESLRAGFADLFAREGVPIDAYDPAQLILFPEMDEDAPVPEITTSCWGILGVDPGDVMCATSRMVVKRKGALRPTVVACTLLPYDPEFELGTTLKEAFRPVPLNHPHCAKFCVLGGGSCSAG